MAFIFIADSTIQSATRGKLYSQVDSIPHNKVGLLLGTGKYLRNGSVNPYYAYRVSAAAQLLSAHRVDYLIISGDNSRKDYNEPQSMKSDLGGMGMDTAKIYLDYAGFRTFDSIVRLKEVFGQDSVTVISQRFHNQRAVYIAEKEGITAIGFNAKDVSKAFVFKVMLREKFARAKVFLDIWTGTTPKYLGNKISIP